MYYILGVQKKRVLLIKNQLCLKYKTTVIIIYALKYKLLLCQQLFLKIKSEGI
ncbi:hypothetical protein WOK_02031 [Enterococcus faecalis EnGen0359]|nr:hypothetical protein WOK_02031 [Enterococcus faecalis EnGen0359]